MFLNDVQFTNHETPHILNHQEIYLKGIELHIHESLPVRP